MLVDGRRPAHHLDVEDALASELDLGRAFVEMVASLDRRAIRFQDLLVRVYEGGEVGTANFLLAFDDELQLDRRTALDPLPAVHGAELPGQIPFRVHAP